MSTASFKDRFLPPLEGEGIDAAAFRLRCRRNSETASRLTWLKLFVVPLVIAALALAVACEGEDEETPPATTTAAATGTALPESPTPTPEPTKLTFIAGFKPQANLPFVGAYVAKEKGFFAEQGLDVKIQHSSTSGENFRFLIANQAQVTTADAAVVLERRSGDPSVPIVAVALIGQRGQQGFTVLADSGIETPKDWEGKTAGYKGSKPTPDYLAILEANNVDQGKIKDVRVGFDPRVLTEGQVDILAVFISNEPDTLRRLGFDVQVFEPADYGVPTLGLTYVVTEDYLADNADTLERFLKAALNGIYYARDNVDEAVDIVLQYAPEANPDHQKYMLETELDAALTDLTEANGVGWMTDQQWQDLYDMLTRFDALSGPLDDLSAAYTDQFQSRIYQEGRLQ